jgi:benzil reductase ((S)-benzoin forming)
MNVLITNTSSGFGQALAMEFLKSGASVYGISRQYNYELNTFGDYHHLTQDLMKLDELKDKLNPFLGSVSTLDLVILNAGILPGMNDIRKTTIEKIMTVMSVNLLANKLIMDTLFEKIPAIYQVVAISSGTAVNGKRGWNAFALSKAALNTLMKLYAGEIPDTHFSAIEPGVIDADPAEDYLLMADDTSHEVRDINGSYNNKIEPEYAANYLVEAMGLVLQEESGVYREAKDLLLAPELGC